MSVATPSPTLAPGREQAVGMAIETPLRDALAAVGAGLLVAGLGAAHGGYFPTSWGWSALALAWTAAIALALGIDARPARIELGFAGALAALAGWFALSTIWTTSVTQSVLETERAIVYPVAVLAILLLVRRRALAGLLGGTLAAVTLVCAYGLATRLFAARLGGVDAVVGQRLSAPLGYWNALGIFAAMGALLAIGFAARGRTPVGRALGAAALVVLLPTLYFTFSRGAWIAIAAGLVATVAIDRRRVQLVSAGAVALAAPALVVLLASRSAALTHVGTVGALGAAATHDGRRLALAIAVAAVASALATLALASAEHRVDAPESVRRAYAGALLLAVAVAFAAVTVQYGSPVTIVRNAYRSFSAPPPRVTSLNQRLFNLSSSGRNVQFRAAWNEFRAHPLIGTGAGTYEQHWLRVRPSGAWKIRDVHNLYLETMAELGIVGLALLAAALAIPLAALARARRHPLASAAAGAYVAYLLHAAVDWDWEMTAVTLTALICATAVLRAAGREDPTPLGAPIRFGGLALVVAVGAFALVGLVGNTATARSAKAVRGTHWAAAAREARTAASWAPWASTPKIWLGEAQVGGQTLGPARESLRVAARKDPRNWEIWFDLALAARRGGAEQRHALATALELNPLSPEVHEFMLGAGIPLSAVEGR